MMRESDRLIAEEDHAELGERAVQLRHFEIRQWLRQIDVADFCADMRRSWRDFNFRVRHLDILALSES
jgi:hypothetical protein